MQVPISILYNIGTVIIYLLLLLIFNTTYNN